MEKLRNYLLKNNLIELYSQLLSFMRAPETIEMDVILGIAPVEIHPELKATMNRLMEEYAKSQSEYRRKNIYGQVIIWESILSAYESLMSCKKNIEEFDLSKDYSNYQNTVNELNKILKIYANMQDTLSELEDTLGVDRFLDRICEESFVVLNTIVKDAKETLEEKTKQYKDLFQLKWSTTNVFDVIGHSLVRRNDDNQVCDQFLSNCNQTILILIDGFGFCQYLWNNGIGSKYENYTFNENVFKWLRDNQLSKQMILGSSFITDTGAGLSQIYLGKGSEKTGIIASKLKDRHDSAAFFETKRISSDSFNSCFKLYNSITDVVSVLDKDATVYYCSKYKEPPSGFSSVIFKSADIKQILPAERVFSVLMDDIEKSRNEGLQVIYFTGIDNSGHTMGAYSNYERLEHKKIDGLIRSFLIELAYNEPDLFDGHRNILITADHGMYESSRIMVSRQEITDRLAEKGINSVRIVENNRAILLYNRGTSSNSEIMEALSQFFYDKELKVDIRDETDDLFYERIGKSSLTDIKPDLAVRFVGEGLFYSNIHANEHLLHFGGHGGYSVDEVFVPLIEIPLTNNLLNSINNRFISKK